MVRSPRVRRRVDEANATAAAAAAQSNRAEVLAAVAKADAGAAVMQSVDSMTMALRALLCVRACVCGRARAV